MTRTQLANNPVTNFSAEVAYTVDGNGQILPVAQQSVIAGGTITIAGNPAQYTGYICAWRNGTCRCASLVTNLSSGDAHMRIRADLYNIAANAPDGAYTIYAPGAGAIVGPIANENNGDLHVGH